MTYNYSAGLEALGDVFTNTFVFDVGFLIPFFLTVLLLIAFSAGNIGDWKILALPISVLLGIIGLKVSLVQYSLAVFAFAISILSAAGGIRQLGIAVKEKNMKDIVNKAIFSKPKEKNWKLTKESFSGLPKSQVKDILESIRKGK